MSASWERLVNEPILDIHPYQPGKPIEEVERALRITVGAPEDNARLIDGLRAMLGKGGARS